MTDAHIIKFEPPHVSKLPPLQGKSKAFNAALDAVGPNTQIERVLEEGMACFRLALAMAEYQKLAQVERYLEPTVQQLEVITKGCALIASQTNVLTPPKGAA